MMLYYNKNPGNYEGKSKSSKTNNINSMFIEVARLFFYIRST